MDVEDHIGGDVAECGRRMGGRIAEEVGYFVHGFFGGGGLGGSNRAEGDEHGQVKGDGVVQEGADYFLD